MFISFAIEFTASYGSANKDGKIRRNCEGQILKVATSRGHGNDSFTFALILKITLNINSCSGKLTGK